MESLIYCLNAIIPVFIMIALGKLLTLKGGADEQFIQRINGYVFKWLIPIMLFINIYGADIYTDFDLKLVVFSFVSTAIIFLVLWAFAARLLPRQQVAAFVQAGFRGNYNLMCVPLVEGLLGAQYLPKAVMLSPLFVAMYNILAVIIFMVYDQKNQQTGLRRVLGILLGIIRNPFIIATALGLFFALTGLKLPNVIYKPISYLSDMAAPVALLGLGGSLSAYALKQTLRPSFCAAIIKTVVTPIIMIPIAIALGFQGDTLGIIAIFFSTPVAVNAYHTAISMNGDHNLTAGAILLSTALSAVSLVFTMTLLLELGLILI